MLKANSKAVLAALLFLLNPLSAAAAELFNLNSLSAGGIKNLNLDIPRLSAAPEKFLAPAIAAQDAGLADSLTPAQWDELFAADTAGETKELLSDFASRYVITGTLRLGSVPPTFTTKSGKVYKVVKHPKWLRNTGAAELCVEGYIRQADNTSELAIDTVLPLDAMQAYAPSAATTDVQRQPYILSKDPRGYALGNVNWGVRHSADGRRLKRPDGVFQFAWPGSVLVRPELLEAAYVGKKTMQKFPFIGTHGFLAFKFKPGGVTDGDGNSVRGLVISLNTYSVIPGVQNQNALDGLRGKFAVHYNINSAEGYVEANVFTDGNRISLYPLTLARERQVQLLRNAIEQATADRTGEMYSVVYNSCTNAVVSFINSVLTGKEKIKDGWLPEIVYRLRGRGHFPAAQTRPGGQTPALPRRGQLHAAVPRLSQ